MKKALRKINSIKKACSVADAGYKYILKEIKPDVSEKELASKLSKFLKNKSEGLSFRAIVAFGESSSKIHHKPGNRKLKNGDNILFDFGVKINGYCSDLSRTVFFGKMNKKQKIVYTHVLGAQQKAIQYLKIKIEKHKICKAKSVDKIARDYIISKKLPSIPHGLGHGIGKKVHSGLRLSPKSKSYLKENMVFTIEPGIYLKKFGIRIEDIVFVGRNGVEILTKANKKVTIIPCNKKLAS